MPHAAQRAQIETKRFQGARTGPWFAPAISRGPNSVLIKWVQDGLTTFLSGGHAGDFPAFGAMGQVADSLSKVARDDVAAVAADMLTGQPEAEGGEAEVEPLSEAQARLGASVFASNCETCHGADGQGAPGVSASLVGNGGVAAEAPHNVVDVLSDAEIAVIANHVRRSWGNAGEKRATPQLVSYLREIGDPEASSVALAANCRAVATETVTRALRDALAGRARSGQIDAEARPDLSEGDRLTAMSGL